MSTIWLAANILWLSLILLLASVVIKIRSLAGLGWLAFGIYWLEKPAYYISISDYFNVALVVFASFFCFYLAWIILFKRCKTKACDWATYTTAVCGIIYFPFAEVEVLNAWIIGQTALLTVWLLQALSFPASLASWNAIALNGRTVEIILACTAIESIALFIGVIISLQASLMRKYLALIASTIIIYSLNIVRNAFVVAAYGQEWFGEESFFVAHNVIAKAGSTVALLIIAYFVLAILPELLDSIDDLARELRHPGGGGA